MKGLLAFCFPCAPEADEHVKFYSMMFTGTTWERELDFFRRRLTTRLGLNPKAVRKIRKRWKNFRRPPPGLGDRDNHFPIRRKEIGVRDLRVLRQKTICANMGRGESSSLYSLLDFSPRPVAYLKCPHPGFAKTPLQLLQQADDSKAVGQLNETHPSRFKHTADFPKETFLS